MSNRRANNRGGRSRANKTNLDDLEGALSGMIRPTKNVKVVVDPAAEEHRFTMHSSNTESTRAGTVFANQMKNSDDIDLSEMKAGQSSNFEKHQVNYGATKYIKPWRTGTKSQQLPPKAGHNKNSGKGGRTYE